MYKTSKAIARQQRKKVARM